MKTIWTAIKAWWLANSTQCPVWYVIYPTGEKTRHLGYHEARSCKSVWGGKLYIDWKYAKEIAAL